MLRRCTLAVIDNILTPKRLSSYDRTQLVKIWSLVAFTIATILASAGFVADEISMSEKASAGCGCEWEQSSRASSIELRWASLYDSAALRLRRDHNENVRELTRILGHYYNVLKERIMSIEPWLECVEAPRDQQDEVTESIQPSQENPDPSSSPNDSDCGDVGSHSGQDPISTSALIGTDTCDVSKIEDLDLASIDLEMTDVAMTRDPNLPSSVMDLDIWGIPENTALYNAI